MSPASYQTAPPRDVCRCDPASPAIYSSVDPLVSRTTRQTTCSSAGLRIRAGNGTRTRDPNLGKVVLYQLSYSRKRRQSNRSVGFFVPPPTAPQPPDRPSPPAVEARGIEPLTS